MSNFLPLSWALLALGVRAAVAQQVPTVALGRPTATFDEPFTNLASVRELPGGKLIAVDPRDKVVSLIDLRSGSATRIGREGSGPGEYRFPSAVLPLPGHEALLVDPAQSRFLRVDPAGKVVETLSYPDGIAPGTRPHGTDAAGRVYFEGASLGLPGGGPDAGIVAADSLPVIRWDRRSGKVDTLVMVKGPQMRVSVSGTGSSRNFSVRRQPFSSRDGWAVGPDGRVAVVRSAPYRVDTRAPSGTRTRGAVLPAREIPVTQAEKDAFLEGLQAERRSMAVAGDGRGAGGRATATPSGPQPPPPSADDFDWPATMPVFDGTSVQMSLTGELWALRSRPAGDPIPVYDVFNADGRLVRRVTVPEKTRLVGFGEGTVYAVRTDKDDLQYLERYRMP
jgi:hypothetical protein